MRDSPGAELADQIDDAGLLPGRGDFAGQGRLAVRDPATGALIAQVAISDATGARAAVDAAHAAFPGWMAMLPQDRARILHRWHALIMAAKEDLSRIMVAEQGKPISEARGEIDYAASFVRFYAEEALRPNIEGVTSHLPDAEMELWREPVGVAALITPWNFPAAMITRKAAAALGAGCTVVIHPSAETPLSALALAELARRAGFPDGVVNTVIGDAASIVGEWTGDARVRALSFTGSTEIGRLLYRQSAETVKRLVLELGGHAPFIVFKGADLDRAVAEAVKAKFATSGQDCLGANRFYIHRPLYDDFCARFTAAVQRLTLGPGMEDPDIGPLIHDRQIDKQKAHVTDALERGARLLCGGQVDARGPLFFQPTVLADVPDDAAIMREETFGPVAALTPFDDEAEVYVRANNSEYGLIAYVHSLDPRRIYRATRALQYGMVAVNRTKVTGAPIPFGGMKQSGLGREGARQGLEAFTEIKYVCRDWG
ncbi:NAD-dependent succinate-semialdehyde dehydrogenase [Paracoccus fistulariae]|uniref:NAD-dependent succinate-semialdehyde dehydrogenase n=1 Tax=Paracoccus fistulariae TaxID=658446 RepID=A0ABY7SKB4_9RHOB|nr:NAD-dependent succinate-semialdehyde dehydrogenase [Paracoccus fistulariae]MDB6181410.1 NAD-dependent succinate-semialdehyde dehydrogenase [Paracoccus fistulariae]WCR07454.1 NAD-dependent succinate-semialdehyde dehydrogenase [Paracoccus fistulariae]